MNWNILAHKIFDIIADRRISLGQDHRLVIEINTKPGVSIHAVLEPDSFYDPALKRRNLSLDGRYHAIPQACMNSRILKFGLSFLKTSTRSRAR